MSWELLQQNNLDLFAKSLNATTLDVVTQNVGDLISDNIETTNMTSQLIDSSTVISNTLQTTTGSNYLGVYSASKVYKLGDQVIFNNLLYRCLVNDTTGIAPDPNDPAQAQWVSLTSNNAVKNDLKYIQVSVLTGNDAKAVNSPVPFKTIQAALNFGGANCTYALIDKTSVYDLPATTFPVNTTIIGVPKSQFARNGSIINITAGCSIQSNISFKDLVIRSDPSLVGPLFFGNNTINANFDNVAFDSQLSDNDMEVWINYSSNPSPDSNIVFNNCSAFTDNINQWLQVRVSVNAGVVYTGMTRTYFYNCKGPWYFYQHIPDVANQGQYETYIVGINKLSVLHVGGLMVIDDCIFNSSLISSAGVANISNKLVVRNSSMYNITSNIYNVLDKTGDCPYIFQDFDFNRDGVSTVLNGTVINDLSTGPATFYNQLTSWGTPGSATTLSIGLTNTADKLNIPLLVSDPFNIIGSTNATSFVINYTGFYEIDLNVETATTTTTGQDGLVDIFLNLSSTSDISTSLARNTMYRGLVNNATTYPTNNVLVSFKLPWSVLNTNPISVYARNTNGQAFNIQIVKMLISRVRKV